MGASTDVLIALGISAALLAAALQKIIPPAPSTAVGIDLGTTFSCVAVFDRGVVQVISVEGNGTILPSVVALHADHAPIVGTEAWKSVDASVIYDAKRFIGRRLEGAGVISADLADEVEHLPFDVVPRWSSARGQYEPHILPRSWAKEPISPERVSSMVLGKLRDAATAHIGRKVRSAVLAVPVEFSESQQNATREAAQLANIEVLRLLHEPTAAAIAYGLHERPSVQSIMVYDLGGGTLDVSLLNLENGILSVVAASGDSILGGQDINGILMHHFGKEALQRPGGCPDRQRGQLALREAVERLKVQLSEGCDCSGRCESGLDTPSSVDVDLCGLVVRLSLTRRQFDTLVEDFADRAMRPIDEVLADVGIGVDEVRSIPPGLL